MYAAEMSNMTDLWLSGVFFQTLNTPKLVFGRGSAPDPAGGAYDAPPDTLVSSGGGLQRLDLGAFSASVVRPPNTNSWLCLWCEYLSLQQI